MAVDAVERLQEVLDEADENGYGVGAWYFYMRRSDIEAVMREVRGLRAGMAILERKLAAS